MTKRYVTTYTQCQHTKGRGMGQTVPPFRQCQDFESAWSLCQVNSSMHQVSGYVNYNIGMEPEVRRIEHMNQWNILDIHNVDKDKV